MGDRETCIKFYNQAVAAIADKSLTTSQSTAFQLFASACQVDPTYWQAQYQTGNNVGDMKCLHAAVAHYRKALRCEMTDAEKSKVYCNLGWRLYELGHVEESLEALQKSLDLDPKCAATWLNMSQAHGVLGQNVTAVECARRCYELAPLEPTSSIAMAFALLFDGQYAEGFKHFEKRFEWRLHSFLQYPYPKWLGEEGKTIFLVADQGLGDTLSFSRFVAHDVRAGALYPRLRASRAYAPVHALVHRRPQSQPVAAAVRASRRLMRGPRSSACRSRWV